MLINITKNQKRIRHKIHLEKEGMSHILNSESLFLPNLEEVGENFVNENKVFQDNILLNIWG